MLCVSGFSCEFKTAAVVHYLTSCFILEDISPEVIYLLQSAFVETEF